MNTYFIRHTKKLLIADETFAQLRKKDLIAIHYPKNKKDKLGEEDADSIKHEDYSGTAKKAMKCLENIAEGGYVCAQYYDSEKLFLGCVEKQKIKLFRGKWHPTNKEGFVGKEKAKIHKNREAILKCLQLKIKKTLSPNDHYYWVLKSCVPQQQTVTQWRAIKKIVEHLVEGKPISKKWDSLIPSQQETVCAEFLRLKSKAGDHNLPELRSLLLPVGRTLEAVDIYGIATDGKKICAQVTYKDNKASKEKALINAKNAHKILFCNFKGNASVDKNGIHIIPVNDVFEKFKDTLIPHFFP